jgi:GNAT superfamily N-acetyltransferase
VREEHEEGLEYLEAVTTLLQRVRSAHPTAGVYEAADFQWWWRIPRSTDDIPQLFWIDDDGRPEAAMIATGWGDSVSHTAIVMPDASADWAAHIIERGLAHAQEVGLGPVEFVVDRSDTLMLAALAAHGFSRLEDEMVDSWLAADVRPPVSELVPGFRLADRLDTREMPHHTSGRSGPQVEGRLRQTSLYRPDLDLVVLDEEDRVAAYGLFWFDPVTATGLVEPMRTEDAFQRRGLARHLLTAGLDLLAKVGAERIKIAFEPDNVPAARLYTDVGFVAVRPCVVATR